MDHLVVHPDSRSDLEQKFGITYCRRCGRIVVKDSDPTYSQPKPCEQVKIELRTPLGPERNDN